MLRAAVLLVGLAASQFTTDSEWIKFHNMKCDYGGDQTTLLATESSLDAAKENCQDFGRCHVIVDPQCNGSKGYFLLDNCKKASKSHAKTCIYMRKGAWTGGAGNSIIGNGYSSRNPTCSYRNSCSWTAAEQEECASAICLASGFDGGRFIFSSGNPCSDTFTAGDNGTGIGWNWKMDENKIALTSPITDAGIVAECYEFAPCQNLNHKQCRQVKLNGESICEWSRNDGKCQTPRGSCAGVKTLTKEEQAERCTRWPDRKKCKASGCRWVTHANATADDPQGCKARPESEEENENPRLATRCKRMDVETCCKAKGCNWNGTIGKCFGEFQGWKDL